MSKFDKECILDHTKYLYCSGCSDYAKYPRWMESFCSDNCRQIFNTVMEYRAGVKTGLQAKAALSKLDLSGKDHFDNGIKEFVTAIMAEKDEEPVVEVKEHKADEPKVEEVPAEEVKSQELVEAADEKKSVRKGNKKVVNKQ